MITVTVYADEVIVRLDQFPRKLREAIRSKLETMIFPKIRQDIFVGKPGQFLDPKTVKTSVEDIGSAGGTVIGVFEAEDKRGVYGFGPKEKPYLKFIAKDGEIVRTKHVYNHPFPKTAPVVERVLAESKPWVIEQLEDAVYGIQ